MANSSRVSVALRQAFAVAFVAGIGSFAFAQAAPPQPSLSLPPTPIQYVEFEGGGPDEGPSHDAVANVASLKATFGPNDGTAIHQYAYGVQEVRILTRSTAFVRAEIDQAFDLAERTDVPVFFHIDPLYGWGADEEATPADAPSVKFWNDPEMREWAEFPADRTHLPTQIPRMWFNWGPWCSPVSAVPAIGAPRFVRFATAQLRDGVAHPIGERLKRLRRLGKSYLFAGINVGWETSLPSYGYIHGMYADAALPAAEWPLRVRGLRIQPWEARAQTGYASLFWQGWTEPRLIEVAKRQGMTRDALFNDLCYHAIHDYLADLAKVCVEAGVPRDHVYTHTVAMTSVDPARANTGTPPVWTAVNAYSIPGFTMDNGGAAVYNLAAINRQITVADPEQKHFAVAESYLFHYGDEPSMRANLSEAFDNGATVKGILGALPFAKTPDGPPQPAGAVQAIRAWLGAGVSDRAKRDRGK